MNPQRIDTLAASWSTGDPDPAITAELESLLLQDPAARRRFLDHCVADMALMAAITEANTAVSAETPTGRHRRRSMPLRRHRPTTPLSWWGAGLAAAAALVAVIVLLAPAEGPTLRIVAGNLLVDGRPVQTGSMLRLPLLDAVAGSDGVECTGPGLHLQIDARTVFALPEPGSIQLAYGQLAVEVDRTIAPPTAVHTAELTAAVTGTRFNVQRANARSEVAVERGRVRVSCPDGIFRDLFAGEEIAADRNGFIMPQPLLQPRPRPQPQPQPPQLIPTPPIPPTTVASLDQPQVALTLTLLDSTGNVLRSYTPEETVLVPADTPFTLRAEVPVSVSAVSFRIPGHTTGRKHRPIMGLEQIPPYYLWGDTDDRYSLKSMPPGQHPLHITCFADVNGKIPLATFQLVVLAQ